MFTGEYLHKVPINVSPPSSETVRTIRMFLGNPAQDGGDALTSNAVNIYHSKRNMRSSHFWVSEQRTGPIFRG